MNIAFFSLSPEARQKLETVRPFGEGHSVTFYDEVLDAEHVPPQTDADVISIFVDSKIDAAVLEHFPNLKFIATRSTGFDHIDLAASAEKGVVVANVPTYGENTVAEHAFGLLLALSKRIFDGYDQLRHEGEYDPHALRGFDLKGRTLGVVGTGNIGKYVIKIGNGFSMRVLGYDAFPKPELQKELNFEYRDTLEELLAESDVITVHVPYLPATHHLIHRGNVSKIKKGAVLINTSRGAIVETEALLSALKDGRLRGAGLDVVEEEDMMKDELSVLVSGSPDAEDVRTALANHVLIDLPNVIMTPHSAFNTEEALERIQKTNTENIKAFIAGTPQNVVRKKEP